MMKVDRVTKCMRVEPRIDLFEADVHIFYVPDIAPDSRCELPVYCLRPDLRVMALIRSPRTPKVHIKKVLAIRGIV
jgi:hypothetical protein